MIEVNIDFESSKGLVQTTTPKVVQTILGSDNKSIHAPIKCKDYFNEVIATEIDQKERSIYGMTTEYAGTLLGNPTFKLALSWSLACSGNIVLPAELEVKFPEDYRKSLEVLLTEASANRSFITPVFEDTQYPNTIVVELDIHWLDCPVYISFLSLLVRLAYGYKDEDISDYFDNYTLRDSSKICNAGDKYMITGNIPKFLTQLYKGFKVVQDFNELLNESTSHIHNNTGVVSYLGYKLNNIVPEYVTEEKEAVEG